MSRSPNSAKKQYKLIDGKAVTSGAWSALDTRKGSILWQTADPDRGSILFAPSLSGRMHALDAASGTVLGSYKSNGSVVDGPSIVDGVVYWGSGYRKTQGGLGNNKVFAFSTDH